jgi:hypothetical protein
MGRSEPFASTPAAHTIFNNPREIEMHGEVCGGRGGGYGLES